MYKCTYLAYTAAMENNVEVLNSSLLRYFCYCKK